ncbi:GumC family protein [Oleisolibacter albus]|uniref:GumC family protein n=1 Tax=Oleisolibacter albus TaxID=2171757 RepID=UPI0013904C54|nr:AAA family ATPase [Oleisolibacter albus]
MGVHVAAVNRLQDGAGDDVTLGQIGRILWRRRIILALTFVLLIGLGQMAINGIIPRYTATTALLLEVKTNSVVAFEAYETGLSKDSALIRSQMDILRSRALARRVVTELALTQDPEFNVLLRPFDPGFLTRSGLVQLLPDPLRARWEEIPPDPSRYAPALVESRVISAVLSRLSAMNDGKSYTVLLSFTSEDAEKAARIANAFAEMYLTSQFENKYQAVERASAWFDRKSEELRQRMVVADRAVQEYREQNQIVNLGQNSLTNEQLARLSGMLIAARTKRAQLEAALREARQDGGATLAGADAAGADPALDTGADVRGSPLLQSLRQQERQVATELAELGTTHRPEHPVVVNALARQAQLRQSIEREQRAVVLRLSKEVEIARAEERDLNAKVNEAAEADTAGSRASIVLRQLMNEADAARSLYKTFLEGAGRISVQLDAPGSDATILSRAERPLGPSYPQRTVLQGLTILGALAAALALVAVLEMMDTGFRAPEQVEQMLGLPVLSMVPFVRGREHASLTALRDPAGQFADAISSVRTAALLNPGGRKPQIIAVTSSLPGEGKTSLALSLGRLTAAAGKRVILVECDLRRPGLRRYLGVGKQAGVAEVVRGDHPLETAIQEDGVSGMHYLTAGSRVQHAVELISTPQMQALVQDLASRYDMVLLDTPPIGVVLDPVVVAGMADCTVLAVRWGKTPRHLVQAAVGRLAGARTRIAGVVMTQVNTRRVGRYSRVHQPEKYAAVYFSPRVRRS